MVEEMEAQKNEIKALKNHEEQKSQTKRETSPPRAMNSYAEEAKFPEDSRKIPGRDDDQKDDFL